MYLIILFIRSLKVDGNRWCKRGKNTHLFVKNEEAI